MFKLQPSVYEKEMPGIRWQGQELCASQFGDSEFMAACEGIARFSRETLLRIWSVYTDNKMFMDGNRRSGEPNWHHPVGVALVGILEFGNTDPDSVISDLLHDVGEDSPIFQGHTNLVGEYEKFSQLDMLRGRYGERVAKTVSAVTKPAPSFPKDSKDEAMKERYLRFVYNRVLNLHPEVRELAARTKVRDRIFNLRTEANPERLARNVVESHRYIMPIAEFGGEAYVDALASELARHDALLNDEQRGFAAEKQLFTVE